jgi:hypothetical protein
MDGWTDGELDGHHHTIICPVFNRCIKRKIRPKGTTKAFTAFWLALFTHSAIVQNQKEGLSNSLQEGKNI